ncbi:MAG: tetratricopeptide repeat protein [Marinicaulis sp.]|nr:tetratricopeptide repeat protein [Marinicaulis sp.]NNL89733.1 tetratricopeptide repeat protein [Marinicaulis sp.]
MALRTKRSNANAISGLKLCVASFALSITAACSSPEQKVEKYYSSGQEFLAEDDLGRASVQFKSALQINEEHVPSLVGMAEIAERRQEFRDMHGVLQRIVRLDALHIESQVKLGQLYLIGSDETTALEQAEKALAIDPRNADALALKGAVQFRLGDTENALRLAREALAIQPGHTEATTILATERTQAKEFDEALKILDTSIATNKEAAILQLLRIRVLTLMGREDDSVDGYRQLIANFPDNSAYRKALAIELIRREDLDGALVELEEITRIENDSIEAKLDVVRLLNERDGADAAAAKLREFAEAEPENANLSFALVDFYLAEDKASEAEDLVRSMMNSKDDETALRATNKMVVMHLAAGNRDQAGVLIGEILERDASNTDALIRRAGLAIGDKDFDAAILDLRSALNNEPDSFEAMALMGAAFEAQGNIDFARAEFRKAFDASEKSARVGNIYAKFLRRNGDFETAEDILTQSLASNPNDRANLQLLAATRLTLQDWRGADEVATIIDALENEGDENIVRNIRSLAMTGLEDFDGVIEMLSAEDERKPLESRPLSVLISAYIRAGRVDQAKEKLSSILASNPDNYPARILMAQVLAANDELDEAEVALVSAVDAEPGRIEAYELLYRYYLRTSQPQKATSLIDGGLANAPENAGLRFFKADIYLSTGNFDAALDLYSDLIQERPNDKIIVNNFVSLTSDLREDPASLQEAVDVSAVLEDESNPFFVDTAGWANYRAGNYDKALTLLSSIESDMSGNAEFLYHLGAAKIATGDVEDGTASLRKALEVGGANFRFKDEVESLIAAN